MSERFKKPMPDHPELTGLVANAITKMRNAQRVIMDTDKAYDYLPKSSQEIVDDLVEGSTDGIKATTDLSWVLAANEEGVDPDTIVRIWKRVGTEATENDDIPAEIFPPIIH